MDVAPRLFAVAAIVAASLAYAGNAAACACCADTSTRFERTAMLQSFDKSELARLRFAPKAFDVPTPEGRNGSYTVTGSLKGGGWRIALSGLPALTFSAPARATSFGTDVHDGRKGGGGGPLLYKELRLSGAASGPGTRYRLILQGRGNNCLAAEDFTHWRLEVTGGKQKLAVWGTFGRPA